MVALRETGRPDPARRPASRPGRLALSELRFPGCDELRMSLAAYRRFEGRLELWDAETRTAWMVRDAPGWEHERPSQRLAQMMGLVAAVRGSPIECYGAMGLVRRHDTGAKRRILHPDQAVYLHPSLVEQEVGDPLLIVGRSFPDVVLEVDHTTDVRQGKLRLYESWGVPELWVEVPDRPARNRPAGLARGLTVHLRRDGAYRQSPESRAFPGWTAEAIHETMNEPRRSERTNTVLERLGRWLGAREGTGPDDDSLMRSLRNESRAEGMAEGMAEMARRILRSRGIEVSGAFPAPAAFLALSVDAVTAAALSCESERDFRDRIRRR